MDEIALIKTLSPPSRRAFVNSCKLLEGTGTVVPIRIVDVVGVEVHLAVLMVEVEIRGVVELTLAVRRNQCPNSSRGTG